MPRHLCQGALGLSSSTQHHHLKPFHTKQSYFLSPRRRIPALASKFTGWSGTAGGRAGWNSSTAGGSEVAIEDGSPLSKSSSSTEIHGWFCWRLANGSDDIGQLGRLMARSFRAELSIYKDQENVNDFFLPVTLSGMVEGNNFPKLEVKIIVQDDDVYSISGFPRHLIKMDFRPH